MLEFSVKNQLLGMKYLSPIVSDTINYFEATFNFLTTDWEDCAKTAHFSDGTTVYDIILVDDEIPASAGLNLTAGTWDVYVHGNKTDYRVTSNTIHITVDPSGVIDGEPLPEVSLTFSEQLLLAAQQSLYDLAVANGYVGTLEQWLATLSGADGNGIASIALTATNSLVKTYTITFDDATTTTFDVTDGATCTPSDSNPLMNGTAAPGTSADYSRKDHVHPSDTSRATAAQGALADTLSHKNLLHNWYYMATPVNQEAKSGDVSSGYVYDNVKRYAGTITIAATYLSYPADAATDHFIEGNALAGKVATVSVMVGGAVISGSGTFPSSAGESSPITLTGFGTATLGYATGYMYVRFTATSSTRQLQAVKLELGTYSTLANDPPPNFGEQLALCQIAYETSYNIGLAPGTTSSLGAVCCSTGTGDVICGFQFKTKKRDTPTVTVYSPGGTVNRVWIFTDSDSAADVTIGHAGASGVRYMATTGLTAATLCTFHYVADARR